MPRLILICAVVLAYATGAAPQTAPPRFDIVSVKRNTSGDNRSTLRPEPNGITGINVAPIRLFRVAYQIPAFQVTDAPDWFTRETYDVTARTATPVPVPQLLEMLKILLAERFGVRVERETRDASAIELHAGQAAPGLRRGTQPCSLVGTERTPVAGAAARAAAPPCFQAGTGETIGRGVTMDLLARELTGYMNMPVVDKTGLDGIFDLELRWTPLTGDPPVDGNSPAITTAITEQLGLRVVRSRLPVDVFVVRAAHRPDPD